MKAQRRLGDTVGDIWTQAELERYLEDGYLQLVQRTRALWDSAHVPDRHSPAYNTDATSATLVQSTRTWQSWAGTNRGERSAVNLGLISDPTPYLGDRRRESDQDGLYSAITSPADVPNVADVAPPAESLLPAEVLAVERATWDGRILAPLTPKEADAQDREWEQYTSEPEAYVLIQKGARKLLKRFRGPSSPADSRAYTGEVGILRGGRREPDYETVLVDQILRIPLTPFGQFASGVAASRISTLYPYGGFYVTAVPIPVGTIEVGWPALTETATYAVSGGPFGIARRVPGAYYTNAPFGFPRRFNPGVNNTRIDYVKKPTAGTWSRFELQDWDTRYLLFYVLARAFDRASPAQDKKMAQHYLARFELGIAMMVARHAHVREHAVYVMGEGDTSYEPAVARLPGNYDARMR